MTFKFWRHGEKKHGEGGKFGCPHFTQNIQKREYAFQVLDLLAPCWSILCDVVGVAQENIMGEESGCVVISAQVRAGNEGVAQTQAEFLAPWFDKEFSMLAEMIQHKEAKTR